MRNIQPSIGVEPTIPGSGARDGLAVRALAAGRPLALASITVVGLVSGAVAHFLDQGGLSTGLWTWFTLPALVALLAEIAVSLRRGEIGLDVIAALSMSAALLTGEALAACIVALMYSGGQLLEAFAEGRARNEMQAILLRAPRRATRHRDSRLEEIATEDIRVQDRLLIRQGEVVPADGYVVSPLAVLDQSALTGEALPVKYADGSAIMSGSTNAGNAFDMVVSRPASASTYAGIVRLVAQAQQSKAPMSRLADRYGLVLLAVTVMLASAAWLLSSDPTRAVAVLVVATPCPLILAVPVALVSGMSRAAANGIVIKGAQVLEALTRVRGLVIDKTGTLTAGRARISLVRTSSDFKADEILKIAASLDQASGHVVARTIVDSAVKQGLSLTIPVNVVETPGEGVEGEVGKRKTYVGGRKFVQTAIGAVPPPQWLDKQVDPGATIVAVGIDGCYAAEIVLRDEIRPGLGQLLSELREAGLQRIVLATGDRSDIAESVASGLSIDAVRSGLTPDQKVLTVLSERKNGPVLMVGDGVNDAPALAAADVGIAMGARGAAASAEAADVVLLADRLDGVLSAILVAQRSRKIALQSVTIGISLSGIGMVAAAMGYLLPVQGALLQEVIDVAVILNALRALKA